MQNEAMWGHPQLRRGEGERSGAHDFDGGITYNAWNGVV
jgi:hypothetical protein